MNIQKDQALAYPFREGKKLIGIKPINAYAILATGEMQTDIVGRRRYVTCDALKAYVDQKRREGQGRAVA